MNFSCLPSVFMCFIRNLVILEHCQHEMSMHWWENTPNKVGGTRVLVPGHQKSGAWAPEVWCPFKLTNRFFVLISRMGFRTLNFSCLPSVFMCSTQNLVLSEHGEHEWACSDEKTRKKWVGAPEFWCPGTRTLVPAIFLTGWECEGACGDEERKARKLWKQV